MTQATSDLRSDVMRDPGPARGNALQLALGTGAFAVCFSVFGSVSAMMPLAKLRLHLTPLQSSVAIAVPVLLGSLGRLPLGILADRWGSRRVSLAVMVAAILGALALAEVGSFAQLVVVGLFVGISLASFASSIGLASGWYPPARQGMALGVYGAGNIGQSLAAFGAPVIAHALGFRWGYWIFAAITAGWLVVFARLAQDPPRRSPPRGIREVLRPLRDRKSWVLGMYYFLTFGGFVAMAIYLPLLLTDLFGLTPQNAGLRTAGFVLVATALRPVGGILADRIGGRRILKVVFPATAAMAILLCIPTMATVTLGALGMAAAIGLGNGAVFKLVPEYFPNAVSSVTGLVGAAGGLGGFFPPLVLGLVKQLTGGYGLGFGLLAMFALACLAVLVVGERGQPARAAA
jgi:NNP family nitrate/nitrite transporter-like MFS transporter